MYFYDCLQHYTWRSDTTSDSVFSISCAVYNTFSEHIQTTNITSQETLMKYDISILQMGKSMQQGHMQGC